MTTQPMFVPSGARQLFAVLHPATAPRGAVVLCQPGLMECPDALRSFRRLGAMLAESGLATLRFDWSCTGDSSGDGNDARWEEWVADVAAAVDAVRAAAGVERVALVGARLGAMLATVAATELACVDRLALWEPVTNGRAHVEELRKRQRDHVEFEQRERPGSAAFASGHHVLGYPLPDAVRLPLRDVDLGAVRSAPADHMLILRNTDAPEPPWIETIERRVPDVTRRVVRDAQPWAAGAGLDPAPLPLASLRAIHAWLDSQGAR